MKRYSNQLYGMRREAVCRTKTSVLEPSQVLNREVATRSLDSDPVGRLQQCATRRLGGKGVRLMESPDEIRQRRERENDQGVKQAIGNMQQRMPEG